MSNVCGQVGVVVNRFLDSGLPCATPADPCASGVFTILRSQVKGNL